MSKTKNGIFGRAYSYIERQLQVRVERRDNSLFCERMMDKNRQNEFLSGIRPYKV